MNNYIIQYFSDNSIWISNPQPADSANQLIDDYKKIYQNDFKLINCWRDFSNINFSSLIGKSMRATQELCSLGNKVRASSKLKNRQPLKSAFIYLADEEVNYYISQIELENRLQNQTEDYKNIIKDELNVINVKFISKEETDNFLQISLKVNFKVLGKKLAIANKGSINKTIKSYIDNLCQFEQQKLYYQLKENNFVNIFDFNFSLEDFEIVLQAKENFASASDKNGVVILDTTLNDNLIKMGFIREFRSVAQNLRKELKFNLTQKINCSIFCDLESKNNILQAEEQLKKYLLIDNFILFDSIENFNENNKNKYLFNINDKELILNME